MTAKERTMTRLYAFVTVMGILLAWWSAAVAQTPPTVAELAAYDGLHAAAARGEAGDVDRLVRAGAHPNRRDGHGRTPLHVAAFQGHGATAEALIAAGSDPHLLDRQRYDAVTI